MLNLSLHFIFLWICFCRTSICNLFMKNSTSVLFWCNLVSWFLQTLSSVVKNHRQTRRKKETTTNSVPKLFFLCVIWSKVIESGFVYRLSIQFTCDTIGLHAIARLCKIGEFGSVIGRMGIHLYLHISISMSSYCVRIAFFRISCDTLSREISKAKQKQS